MTGRPLTLPARDVAELREYLQRASDALAARDVDGHHAATSELAGYLRSALDVAERAEVTR